MLVHSTCCSSPLGWLLQPMCTNRHVGLLPTVVLWMTSAILAMAVNATFTCSLCSALWRCFWYLGRVRKHVLDDVSGVAVNQACIKSKNELQTLVKHLLKTQVQSWNRCHTKYNHTKIPKTTTTTIWLITASLSAILVVWEALEPPGMLLKQRHHKLSIRSFLKQNDQNDPLYRSGNTIRSSSSSAVHSERLRHGKGPAARHGGVWSRAPRDGAGADDEEARVDAVAVVEADLAWADVCDGFIMIQFIHDTATILETRKYKK